MEYTEIRYEQRGEIVIIAFNRPEVLNCVGPRTHVELCDAWERFGSDRSAKVAVITGTGERAFCTGGDLKHGFEIVSIDPEEVAAHNRGEKPGYLGPTRRTDIYKPIIAAVNGAAYAGGFEWACFADIRIVEEHATFGVTCRRWNIGLGDGGTQRMPRIIGLGRALELIITGRVIDAEEAYRIGLANEVVARGKSLMRAIELAEFICTLPQPALRTDKEAAIRGFGLPLDEGLRIEAECFNKSIQAAETLEGLRQFIERDHPDRKPGAPTKTPGLARS